MASNIEAGSPYVYTVLRTDYTDRDDDEGRQQLVSCHGSLNSANRAAKDHVKKHNAVTGIDDPNSNETTHHDGTTGVTVMVGEEDYHSYQVNVHKEELHDGVVIPAEDLTEEVQEATKKGKANGSKTTKATTTTSKTKAKPKPEPKDEDEGDEDSRDAENDTASLDDLKHPPAGAPNCLTGLTFLITGTLEGFKREEAQDLITRYGGSMGKKLDESLDYVVLGVKAGPKKLETIRELELHTIDQKGLYRLIESRSKGGAGGKGAAAPAAAPAAAGKGPAVAGKAGKGTKRAAAKDDDEDETQEKKRSTRQTARKK